MKKQGETMRRRMSEKMEQSRSERWRRKLPKKYREYTASQMKAECDEFYRQIDQLIEKGSSLEEMQVFMEKNQELITAGKLFTVWSKEQLRKMLEAKKD